MFVLELTYTAPIESVEPHLDAHVEWLDRHFADGTFLASGRKNPRDGGVIIAVGEDRAAVEKIAAADPFSTAGVCEYRVTEFIATKTAPELAPYKQQLPS
ncbi:YciI family protein [Streptomyces sp. LHD-70]|uniref:YciI family protein n=1 Tax=Streptomyces sp. LHD-70 TaxID=3072140 RepID=UPI00280FB57B|nr:YciI family protein [Streptomyces sp. LHD-70]MDQ8706275.1 YciI family protein [Streptomyces sp. LHD-70]